MANKKSNTEKTQPDDVLSKVLKDFTASWDYTSSSWHKRWQDNYYLYNNERVNRGYEGITDTFVPMTFSTIETLTSALFGTKPKFEYMPPQERAEQETDILNGLLDHYWDKDQWTIKVINTGRTGLMLGTGIDYYYWDTDHPRIINVPLRDFFVDPTATNWDNAKYMGRRYLTTIDELKGYEIVDPETGEMKPKYKNLDKIRQGNTGEPTDKEEKDMWYGSTVSEPEENQVECIEYWTDDKVYTIVNRSTVIEDTENYYKAKARANGVEYPEGIMPFNGFRDYVDPSLFFAKGEVDFIAGEQELLNDITNQNVDAVTWALNPMHTLDPKYAHMINEIENLPGAVYPVEAGALQPITMATVPADAFNERMNIKNEMRETTASNEIVKGAQQDGNATATEINAQIAGSGQRINLKVTQIEDEYFHRMAKIVFEMIKLYVTEPMMVRIIGKDGAKWEEFDPADFQGDYEPRVQLDISIENKKQEEADNAKEMLAAFLNDPEINQQELKKLVLAKSFNLEPDEVQLLMGGNEGMALEEELLPEEVPMDTMPEDMMGLAPEDVPIPELPPEEGLDSLTPEELMMLEEQIANGGMDENAIEVPVIEDPITGELIPVPEEEMLV